MDSVGATARTPRQSRSPLRAARHSANSTGRGSAAWASPPAPPSYGSVSIAISSGASSLSPRKPRRHTGGATPTDRQPLMGAPPTAVHAPMAPLPTKNTGQRVDSRVLRTPKHRRRQSTADSMASVQQASRATGQARAVKVALYGMLNTVICIPVMISFAQIIFRHPAFQPYMADLIKLVLTSAGVHQLCFTLSSTLPFAIGQVQDAGLIFLSAMASSIVRTLTQRHESSRSSEHDDQPLDMDTVLATTLFTLATSTALLGVALIITGKLRIASFVQYLPMPVVGGYLAYIGFYCLEAGLSMMSNQSIQSLSDWGKLASIDSLMLISPGLLAGAFLFVALSRSDHVAILPGCMLTILVVFYVVLLLTGSSLEDARRAGWVAPPPATPRSITEVYTLYDVSRMDTSLLPAQLPTWIAMYFVVAFSSSLDVAAIEMSLGAPLDHNHELQTVGVSNLVSGLTGGFTGSYIFSQTIFTMRAQLDSRAGGFLIVLLEAVVVLSPVSVIAFVPKIFFGALQTLIAADLMLEWMWHARHKLLPREYAIVWLTFAIMNVYNLEVGIVLGIVIAAFNFIGSYIAVSSVRRVMRRSRVERDLRERALLERERLSIVALELDGFLFFGSSVQMMTEVRKHVLVTASEAAEVAARASPLLGHPHPHPSREPAQERALLLSDTESEYEDGLITLESGVVASPPDQQRKPMSKPEAVGRPTLAVHPPDRAPPRQLLPVTRPRLMSSPEYARLREMNAVRTRFFVLDFERVRGVDATAVRSCFLATKQLLTQHGITLAFSNVPPTVERLLRVHDVLEQADGSGEGALVFETLDRALEWCEDEILVEQGLLPLASDGSIASDSDGDALVHGLGDGHGHAAAHDDSCRVQLLDALLPPHPDDSLSVEESAQAVLSPAVGALYIEPVRKQAGDCVYRAGHVVAGTYFIGYGKVDVYLPSKLHEGMGPGFRGRKRILRVCQGGIIGASELILNKRHHFTAVARAPTFLFFLSKAKYKRMLQDHPRLAARFQQAMLQTMARSVMESNIADD